MGLWLVQECRREWQRAGEDHDYGEMVEMAAAAPAFGPLIYPGDGRFLAPGDMSPRIRAFCRETGQRRAGDEGRDPALRVGEPGAGISLGRREAGRTHRQALGTIHIIGGGSKNELLDQFAADATGRTVVTGPIEATALGNVLVQALALGHIGSIAEGREVIARSFELKTFTPRDTAAWDAAYERYLGIREK